MIKFQEKKEQQIKERIKVQPKEVQLRVDLPQSRRMSRRLQMEQGQTLAVLSVTVIVK